MLKGSFGVLFLLAVATVAVPPSPAAARCIGPTIRPVGSAVRGATITVQGTGFGDNCYDTGPPPSGERALGVPLTDIELYVAQGAGEVMVARGSADAVYEFAVDITVPPRLAPGPARLIARWGTDQSVEQPFAVPADQPVAEPPGTTPIIPFGSNPETTVATSELPTGPPNRAGPAPAEPAPDSDSDGRDLRPALLGASVVAVLTAVISGSRWSRWRKRS